MEISLTEDLEDFVKQKIAEGEYASETEIAMAGLQLLKAKLQQDGFPIDKPKEEL